MWIQGCDGILVNLDRCDSVYINESGLKENKLQLKLIAGTPRGLVILAAANTEGEDKREALSIMNQRLTAIRVAIEANKPFLSLSNNLDFSAPHDDGLIRTLNDRAYRKFPWNE